MKINNLLEFKKNLSTVENYLLMKQCVEELSGTDKKITTAAYDKLAKLGAIGYLPAICFIPKATRGEISDPEFKIFCSACNFSRKHEAKFFKFDDYDWSDYPKMLSELKEYLNSQSDPIYSLENTKQLKKYFQTRNVNWNPLLLQLIGEYNLQKIPSAKTPGLKKLFQQAAFCNLENSLLMGNLEAATQLGQLNAILNPTKTQIDLSRSLTIEMLFLPAILNKEPPQNSFPYSQIIETVGPRLDLYAKSRLMKKGVEFGDPFCIQIYVNSCNNIEKSYFALTSRANQGALEAITNLNCMLTSATNEPLWNKKEIVGVKKQHIKLLKQQAAEHPDRIALSKKMSDLFLRDGKVENALHWLDLCIEWGGKPYLDRANLLITFEGELKLSQVIDDLKRHVDEFGYKQIDTNLTSFLSLILIAKKVENYKEFKNYMKPFNFLNIRFWNEFYKQARSLNDNLKDTMDFSAMLQNALERVDTICTASLTAFPEMISEDKKQFCVELIEQRKIHFQSNTRIYAMLQNMQIYLLLFDHYPTDEKKARARKLYFEIKQYAGQVDLYKAQILFKEPQDKEHLKELLTQSAKHNPAADHDLGLVFFYEKNYTEAFLRFESAAERGYEESWGPLLNVYVLQKNTLSSEKFGKIMRGAINAKSWIAYYVLGVIARDQSEREDCFNEAISLESGGVAAEQIQKFYEIYKKKKENLKKNGTEHHTAPSEKPLDNTDIFRNKLQKIISHYPKGIPTNKFDNLLESGKILGAKLSQGPGSKIKLKIGGNALHLHTPHGSKDKSNTIRGGRLEDIKDFEQNIAQKKK